METYFVAGFREGHNDNDAELLDAGSDHPRYAPVYGFRLVILNEGASTTAGKSDALALERGHGVGPTPH
jgi:hypothetical protein